MRLPEQQMQAGNRLERRRWIFTCIECSTAFSEGFGMIALEAERQTERQVRTSSFALRLLIRGRLLAIRREASLERKICLCTRKRRIQRNCAPIRFSSFLYSTQITENESSEIVRIRVCRIEIDRASQKTKCFFSQAAIVENLRKEKVQDG